MSVEFDLTKEDFFRYYLCVNKRGKLGLFNITVGVICLLALISIVSINGVDYIKLFVTILLATIIWLVLIKTATTLAISNNGPIINQHTLSIDPQGVTEKIKYRTTIIEWGGVKDVVADSSNIYLFYDNGDAGIIPKRSFSNSEEALKFLRLATSYWTTAK